MTTLLIAPLIPPSVRPSARGRGRAGTARTLPVAVVPVIPVAPDDVLYGFGRIDASGRVADRAATSALGWQPGDRLTLTAAAGVVTARRDLDGLITMPSTRCSNGTGAERPGSAPESWRLRSGYGRNSAMGAQSQGAIGDLGFVARQLDVLCTACSVNARGSEPCAFEHPIGHVPCLAEQVRYRLVVKVQARHECEKKEEPGSCHGADFVRGRDRFPQRAAEFVLGSLRI
jgi:hypothetical protein